MRGLDLNWRLPVKGIQWVCKSLKWVVDKVVMAGCAKMRYLHISSAAVAQWIEYWPPKPRVVGSIPARRTKFEKIRTMQHKQTEKTRPSIILLLAAWMITGACWGAENCKNPSTQMAINTCISNDYAREDAQLNANYKQLMGKLDSSEKERLKEVQRAWIQFRDLQCEFEAAQYAGGSMEASVRAQCLARVTKQRNKDLKEMLADTAR